MLSKHRLSSFVMVFVTFGLCFVSSEFDKLNEHNTNNGIIEEETFDHQQSLTNVHLNNRNLTSLPDDKFDGSPNIIHILLDMNRLKTLPERIFHSQTKLRTVNLSRNHIESLPNNLLKHTKSLISVDLSHNELKSFSWILFANLFSLTEISLSYNQLIDIDQDAFDTFQLQYFYFQSNHFAEFELTKVKNRKYIEMKSNNNSSPPSQLYKNVTNIDLSHNQISSFATVQKFMFLHKSIVVNLSNNEIRRIHADEIDYSIFSSPVLKSYFKNNIKWTWVLKNNPFECDCGIIHFLNGISEHFENHLKLSIHDLKCNNPKGLRGTLAADLKFEDVDCPLESVFPNVDCPEECKCSYRNTDGAFVFNCSNRDLSQVPTLPTTPGKNYVLNIKNNHILELPYGNQLGYDQIIEMNARNNSLTSVSDDQIPVNVTQLDISTNPLGKIDTSLVLRLNESGKLQHLIITDIPRSLECDNEFRENFEMYSEKIKYQNFTCKAPTVTDEPSTSVNQQYDQTIAMTVSAIFGCFCLILGCVIALYSKYQQQVKVYLFAHNLWLWFVTEYELDKDKKYDAFISFSHKDEDFVMNKLIPELENESHSYKICLHMRDWVPGELISEQIIRTVEDSRRTIIILSPDFMKSIWGRMEFRVAYEKAMEEGWFRLIVVLYGDVGNIEQLDNELKTYLNTTTYVKWGDPWFFDKLRYALPHKSVSRSNDLHLDTIQ